jgi:hypothetical protein
MRSASGTAASASRACSASARVTSSSPAMATLKIGSASLMKRSCRNTPTRASFGQMTCPPLAGSSPHTIFRKVVLPEPFAPTSP